MNVWTASLISVIIVSLISFIGLLTIPFKEARLKKIILFLVSFSTGALLGDAFIHLLPEIIEETGFTLQVSLSLLGGVLIFFILEKFVHWRHCHIPTSKHHPHPLVFMNLVGDALHNFIDGMIIAGSYLINFKIGLATTIAVIFHEIPQEIGDFGIFLHAGLTKMKALAYNFISALTAVVGAIIVLAIGNNSATFIQFLIPLTAGGFIYIAASDLIPELHKETDIKKSAMQLLGILLGVVVMISLLFLE
ncbi:MAG: ZIP family metal transporter [Nanoarchaeota archaeon]